MNIGKMKVGAMALAYAVAGMAGAQEIGVSVDGRPVRFQNGHPESRNGRILVPLRGVFEEMGAYVQWRADTQTVIANKAGHTVRLRIGARQGHIDGRAVRLDVPAVVENGTTLVPIRFLSESLGADVLWDDRRQMVMIETDGRAQQLNPGRDNRPGRGQNQNDNTAMPSETRVLQSDTVIPVQLDTPLSSNENREGDRFTATVRTGGDSYYGFLPAGTRIEGRVVAAKAKSGDDPGLLELDFQRLRLPNGRSYDIDGQLISLDNTAVTRTDDGEIRAKPAAKDKRAVYAGYGAGAGLIVGLLTKKPVETGLIGGVLGYLAGEAERARNKPADVRLKSGTEFGVRLTDNLSINTRDIR